MHNYIARLIGKKFYNSDLYVLYKICKLKIIRIYSNLYNFNIRLMFIKLYKFDLIDYIKKRYFPYNSPNKLRMLIYKIKCKDIIDEDIIDSSSYKSIINKNINVILNASIKYNNIKMIKLLCGYSLCYILSSYVRCNYNIILDLCLKYNNYNALKQLIYGDINNKTYLQINSYKCLMKSTENNNIEFTKFLLDTFGITDSDIDYIKRHKHIALINSVNHNNTEICKLIIKKTPYLNHLNIDYIFDIMMTKNIEIIVSILPYISKDKIMNSKKLFNKTTELKILYNEWFNNNKTEILKPLNNKFKYHLNNNNITEAIKILDILQSSVIINTLDVFKTKNIELIEKYRLYVNDEYIMKVICDYLSCSHYNNNNTIDDYIDIIKTLNWFNNETLLCKIACTPINIDYVNVILNNININITPSINNLFSKYNKYIYCLWVLKNWTNYSNYIIQDQLEWSFYNYVTDNHKKFKNIICDFISKHSYLKLDYKKLFLLSVKYNQYEITKAFENKKIILYEKDIYDIKVEKLYNYTYIVELLCKFGINVEYFINKVPKDVYDKLYSKYGDDIINKTCTDLFDV